MPFPDITDPTVRNFLQECYEKETQSRLSWREKHSHMFQKAGTFRKDLKNYTRADIDYALAAAGMVATARDHVEAARYRLTSAPDGPTNGDIKTSESALVKMFPVEPEHETLRVEEGRKAYLRKRNELNPEDKYVFPETSSWIYGWRLNDSEMKATGSRYPRVGVMNSALYNRVGPQPDPDYYHDPKANISFLSKVA